MAIRPEQLQPYLDDYADVTGKTTDNFICPITLRECPIHEVINGHILNKSLIKASSRTVLQWGRIDHFYGSRVEPETVKFLNQKGQSELDFLKEKGWRIEFADGTTAETLLAKPEEEEGLSKIFPSGYVQTSAGEVRLFVKVKHGDPRLDGRLAVELKKKIYPAHWAGAMLKAGYLTLFEMMGYRIVFDPATEFIRTALDKYFQEQGDRDDAKDYFADFNNAAKVLGVGDKVEDLKTAYRPSSFDTLDDRIVMLIANTTRNIYAATCIFKVNDVTISVALPQCLSNFPASVAWQSYRELMENGGTVPALRAQLIQGDTHKEDRWQFEEKIQPVHFDAPIWSRNPKEGDR